MTDGIHRRLGASPSSVSSVWCYTLFFLVCGGCCLAQQDERSVRIAFVYNLTKYVTWPAANQNINICVLGEGATATSIKELVDGKQSEGRTVRVMIRPSEANARYCNMAYFPKTGPSQSRAGLVKAITSSDLTVGEDDSFVHEGGMVAFVRSGDSIQIEINTDNVKAAGLNISSRLLDLAVLVHKGRRG